MQAGRKIDPLRASREKIGFEMLSSLREATRELDLHLESALRSSGTTRFRSRGAARIVEMALISLYSDFRRIDSLAEKEAALLCLHSAASEYVAEESASTER